MYHLLGDLSFVKIIEKRYDNNKPKVLVIPTCRKTRGGITSVIKEYEKCQFWENNK